jgi:hypothetical protein
VLDVRCGALLLWVCVPVALIAGAVFLTANVQRSAVVARALKPGLQRRALV